ncbi:hypothetical protein [Flavihumibacter sp. UBA7668]|uniref:hypothetical protein n=1 Tax=Flavihumibacter sp. UBA7668 TaxID=1946542 RepID=UPI0025B7C2FC|nr:hypothetical protein [Flavihumibacter sp. UBA7668]
MKPISQYLRPNIKIKKGDTIVTLLFLTSIFLTIWSISIYRLTIIDKKHLFAPAALGTLIAFVIILFRLKTNYSLFWKFINSVTIGSGLFIFGLLYLNQEFANKETYTDDFPIIKTGNLARGRKGRCSQPYAIIDFYGTQKQLVFYCEYEKTIKNYTKVTVTFSKGLFTFDVIKSIKLLQ